MRNVMIIVCAAAMASACFVEGSGGQALDAGVNAGDAQADASTDAGEAEPLILIYGTWRVTSFVVSAPDGSVTDYVNFLAPCDQDNDWIFREGEYEITDGEVACPEGEGILNPWTGSMDLADDGSTATLAEFSPVYDSDPTFAATYDIDVNAETMTFSATYEFDGGTFSEEVTFDRLM